MERCDKYLILELSNLNFPPYEEALPELALHFEGIADLEKKFCESFAGKMTKRQAVAFGLLSRTYQLSCSCLANQLYQNYAGWMSSYRTLLETLFVMDWLQEDHQRFESYFEEKTPGIGKIKARFCVKHPDFLRHYDEATRHCHVSDNAFYLPRQKPERMIGSFPFCASDMSISGYALREMMSRIREVLNFGLPVLRQLIADEWEALKFGKVIWDEGSVSAKYGCLGFEPKVGAGES